MTSPLFTEFATVADVQGLPTDRFRGAATTVVTKPRVRGATCNVAVAYDRGTRLRNFPFVIDGRPAAEISNDLAAQIIRWMETNG
jgi:hypothetical protein